MIIEEIESAGKQVKIVPASWQSFHESVEAGFEIVSLDRFPFPDIYLDSFDQATRKGEMVKGGGGAMLREKILAAASRRRIFVGEGHKIVEKLNRPVPVEITPFATGFVAEKLKTLGARLSLRVSNEKNGPIISENGNFLGDADFGEIDEPEKVEKILRQIPGILENGLFIGYADMLAIVNLDGRVEKIVFR
ncbi:MAG: ribose 5-phosphate isomerase A, partial [Candidatus Caldarchaeum sp.]